MGEAIAVQITFSEEVLVSGSPRLALEIGDDSRYATWDEEASVGAFVAFRYQVTLEDRDEDGVSIGPDALDLGDGAIRNAGGVDADVTVGPHAITNAGNHHVLGAPPQLCSDERSLALRHSRKVVGEWNGTPFRVDMVRNFPDFVTDADLRQLLDPIGRLADQIEAQLGYRILEMGDLIEVPARTSQGWDQGYERYWRERRLVSEPGQMLAFYLNDNNQAWDDGGSMMSAHLCCGTTSYNKRALGLAWTGDDPCCQGDANQFTREGETLVHEVFHLLGFVHTRADSPNGVPMSYGALHLPWRKESPIFHAARTDISALGCIFPEEG